MELDFLDLPRVAPSPEARAMAATLHRRCSDAQGRIGLGDAEMLLTLIATGDASLVVEIGVASGASSLFILGMMDTLPGRRQLLAVDSQPRYYADETKPTGFLALDSEFNRDDRFVLDPEASSLDLRALIAARALDPAAAVDLAFIDGDHRHPWPTIDFLLLLPLMREGGTIVLHDINLPSLLGMERSHGPARLFSRPFPDRLVVRGPRPNMGAIRLGDRSAMIDLALGALAEPWEAELGEAFARRFMEQARAGALADRVEELGRLFPARP